MASVGVVVDTTNLEGSIWTWWREKDGKFQARKTATIPPEPADPAVLPDLLKGFGAVPPLVTDIDLSLDDKYLYVSCWGTGELRQYDVSDPMNPKFSGSVHIGGIVRRTDHPNGRPFRGGPQMIEISRDGKRVYWTNSLYSTWDNQFYPEGVPAAMVKANVGANGELTLEQGFLRRIPGGLSLAPDQARRRRLLHRQLLLPVRALKMFGWHSTAALWAAVVLSGLYHGANPGMGWPLAVSGRADGAPARRACPRRSPPSGRAISSPCWRSSSPFSMMTALLLWQRQIRLAAGVLVIGLGIFLLFYRRHPRFLTRVPPHRLVLWSFLVATAHGAALMLAPIYLGLCAANADAGHAAMAELMGANSTQAVLVAALHTFAMVTAGGLAAACVYSWFGLKALSAGWFNLDMVWALSLILVGALAIAFAA